MLFPFRPAVACGALLRWLIAAETASEEELKDEGEFETISTMIAKWLLDLNTKKEVTSLMAR